MPQLFYLLAAIQTNSFFFFFVTATENFKQINPKPLYRNFLRLTPIQTNFFFMFFPPNQNSFVQNVSYLVYLFSLNTQIPNRQRLETYFKDVLIPLRNSQNTWFFKAQLSCILHQQITINRENQSISLYN